jgi:hypothetical protein
MFEKIQEYMSNIKDPTRIAHGFRGARTRSNDWKSFKRTLEGLLGVYTCATKYKGGVPLFDKVPIHTFSFTIHNYFRFHS